MSYEWLIYQGSEDTGTSNNPLAVTSVKAASSGAGTPVSAAAKQSLPFVQVTMSDYMDDDDLPATVSYSFLFRCLLPKWGNPMI
jgi:hypothetical protein